MKSSLPRGLVRKYWGFPDPPTDVEEVGVAAKSVTADGAGALPGCVAARCESE